MRIHTKLDWSEMHDVLKASGAPISFERLDSFGSKTHTHAHEVRLEGTGGRNNTGLYGSGDYDGATWDEWGAFFGALYDADPDARCGGSAKRPAYANAEHYHYTTGDRFRGRDVADGMPEGKTRRTYLPEDTHPRHRWVYEGVWGDHGTAGEHCSKCSAKRPGYAASAAFRADQIGS